MNTIIQEANYLTQLRDQINTAKEVLKSLQDERDQIQSGIIADMTKAGLKSIKTHSHNFSITTKKDIKVVDEEAILKELKDRKLYNEYVKPKLDTIAFKLMANSLLKETGEIMEGTEQTETEYMSIKSNK